MVSFSTFGRLTKSTSHFFVCAFVAFVMSGCSGRPPRLDAPKLNAEDTVALALEKYDSDSNGELSASELAASPGIQSNLAAYDLNGDKKLTGEELSERIQFLAKLNFALTSMRARVQFNGAPLEGAQIELTPEPHFEGQIKTGQRCHRFAGMPLWPFQTPDLPEAQRGLKGIHTGTYRVSITHPDKKLPAKYNSETTLGYETKIGAPSVVFELRN